MLLSRLRTETRAAHDAIERALDLTAPALTRSRYVWLLERFYGFYRPLEEALCAAGMPGLDLSARRKAPLLAADLAVLGADAARVPECAALPPRASPDDVAGCVYVLEGATLGGQVISRHLHEALALGPGSGARFFHGYGAATGDMWQDVRTAIESFAARACADDVVRAAAATFATLQAWCEEAS